MLVDGHGYYQFMNMLCADAPILSLNPERKQDIKEATETAMGKAEYTWLTSGATLCNGLGTLFCSPKVAVQMYDVDAGKLEAAKEKGKDGCGAGFVSTNDVLTSTFGNATNAEVLTMAINYRDKVCVCSLSLSLSLSFSHTHSSHL